MGGKRYLNQNVYEAALERLHLVFDEFDRICVAFSGGKDSTALLHLTLQVARERNRLPIDVMFIDLEGQYRVTIEHVTEMLNLPEVRPWWICLPLNLRNAVSVFQPHWCCWDPENRDIWVRPLPEHPSVISDPSVFPWWRHRMEFEEFVPKFNEWLAGDQRLANLVAIRADESLHRYTAVARQYGEKKSAYHSRAGREIKWGTVSSPKTPNIVSLYPIYDWRVEDIWTYIGRNKLPYNKLYDMMYLAGMPLSEMRICQPYGDDQRKGLDLWHKVEPETWFRVLDRVAGCNYGARYARDKMLGYHRGLGLPPGHTWKSYTFFLLSTLPDVMRERYLSNFAVFLEWWMRHGYPEMGKVHDDETPFVKTSGRRRLPSWRRLALAILKNDFLCKSLSIGQIKDVFSDVYERVQNGQPVKVRKSVQPVYEWLRGQYAAYLERGIEGVAVEFTLADNHLEEIKRRYTDL